MMTETWNAIETVLEARSKGPLEDLLGYIRDRHGEHEADELMDFIKDHPLPEVQRHVALKWMDKRANELTLALSNIVGKGGGGSQRPPSSVSPGGRAHDKGSSPAEPPVRPDRSATAGSKLSEPSPGGGHAVGGPGLARKPQTYSMTPGAEPTSSKELGAEPGHTSVVKPTRPGDFLGQHWQPAAYSAPEKNKETDEVGEVEQSIERELSKPRPDLDHINRLKAKLGILQRRMGGFKQRSIQHGSQATGQMARGAVRQNPAQPRSVVKRVHDPAGGFKNVPWEKEHPGWYWAGDKHGWVSKSEYVTLVGSGEVATRRRD